MKRLVGVVCAVGFFISSFAQPANLILTTQKTTSLIFPFPIKHVDRGSKDVLAEPVKEADNILLLKAGSKDFPETNLSIVTCDGSVYSFSVCYGEPAVWIYHVPAQVKTPLSAYASSILDNPKTTRGIKYRSWDMFAQVTGIYSKDGALFFQLRLHNGSAIDYDINRVRFYIRDQRKARRTAMQEIELTPLCTAGNTSGVKANSSSSIVVAFEKFTIPDAQLMAIEIGEKNGGRNLTLKIGNKKIMKAISLPDLK